MFQFGHICAECGEPFWSRTAHYQRFCSVTCRRIWTNREKRRRRSERRCIVMAQRAMIRTMRDAARAAHNEHMRSQCDGCTRTDCDVCRGLTDA